MQTASTPSPDPILETQLFWTRYKMPILVVLALVLCGAAGYGAFRIYSARRDASAAALLAQAKSAPDYQKVIADYPGAGAAASASLFLAAEQREKQQYMEANATLEKFVSANPMHELVTTAKMAMAANLDSLGKGDQALEMYRQIAANHAQSYNAPLALLAQAQLLKGRGQIEEARRVCETVMTQYRESYATLEATQMLKALKPAVVAPVVAASTSPTPVAAVAPSVPPVKASPAASTAPKP